MASLIYEREIGATIPGVGHLPSFLRPHPGAFRQFMCPHPVEFSQYFLQKMVKPGVSPGGGGRDGHCWNWLMHNQQKVNLVTQPTMVPRLGTLERVVFGER